MKSRLPILHFKEEGKGRKYLLLGVGAAEGIYSQRCVSPWACEGELSCGKTSDLVLNFKFELLLPPRNLWQNVFCDIGGQKRGREEATA